MTSNQSYQAPQEPVVPQQSVAILDRFCNAIYSTRNYSQFKFDPRNRAINPAKLVRLYDAVSQRNLLVDNPILVSPDFTVLDGQHRLKVAESLEVPIYYQFSAETQVEDVPEVNSTRTAWTAHDYLASWCERGAEEYLTFRDFLKRFDWMPITMARQLCFYGDKFNLSQMFNRGTYRCNNIDFATKVAYALLDFRAVGFQYWNSNVFIHTVSNLIANADYDHDHMMRKLAKNSVKLRGAVTMDEYFVILSEIYNYGRRGTPDVVLRKLETNEPKYRADKKAERKQGN